MTTGMVCNVVTGRRTQIAGDHSETWTSPEVVSPGVHPVLSVAMEIAGSEGRVLLLFAADRNSNTSAVVTRYGVRGHSTSSAQDVLRTQ